MPCKLQRLLDGYLDQDIDQQTYRTRQGELMSEKKSLEEQIGKLTLVADKWYFVHKLPDSSEGKGPLAGDTASFCGQPIRVSVVVASAGSVPSNTST